ncbi:ATP-binding protein [Parvibaculum sp.]|uniref:sensor histidine kinase n=1 Tax=Parvibaculum sp. TaxID=2024848 RepID=UPI00320FF6DC
MSVSNEDVERRYLAEWIRTQNWFLKTRFPFYSIVTGYVGWVAWGSIWGTLIYFAIPTAADLYAAEWRLRVGRQIDTIDVGRYTNQLAYYVPIVFLAYLAPLIIALYAPGFDDTFLVLCSAASLLAHMTAAPTPRLSNIFLPVAISMFGFIFPMLAFPYVWTVSDFTMAGTLAASVLCMAYVQQEGSKKRFGAELEREFLLKRQIELLGEVKRAKQIAEVERNRAEEANRIKSAFLAMMSHEIRTPMNAVMGFSDFLTKISREPKTQEYGGYIHSASQSLLTILNDVLDFSKMEADKTELDLDEVGLPELMESLLFWRGKACEKNIEFRAVYQDLPAAPVMADEGRLRQVISNLISNALKFTPENGSVSIEAFPIASDAETLRVRFEVRDTGIGFTDEAAEKLFQPFVQANGKIAKHFGGTGLGLAICAKLVALMGGEIGAKGQPGEGALFWFEVPFRFRMESRETTSKVA